MPDYRDDLEAMAVRNEAMQSELDEKRREVEELRRGGPPAERLAKLEQDLAAAQAELSRLRAPRESPRRAVGFVAVTVVLLVTMGAAVVLLASPKRSPTRSSVVLDTPPPPPAVVMPPIPTVTPALPPATAPREPAHLSTSWSARVVSVRGSTVAVGTSCTVEAALSNDQKLELDRLRVLCGTKSLYSSEDSFSGMSSSSWDVGEEAAPGGKYRRSLVYEDSGDRQGRNDVAIDTPKGFARIWSGGAVPMEIGLKVERLDPPSDVAVRAE